MSRQPDQRVVHKEGDYGHLIGSPRVVVDRYADKAVVWLHGRPWGMPDPEREFLNPESPRIDLCVQDVLAHLRAKGEQKFQRKERLRAARDASR